MYCQNCGRSNPENAIYCQRCGYLTENEDFTVIARHRAGGDAGENEEPILMVGPTMKFIRAGYATAFFAAILLAAVISLAAANVSPWLSVAFGFAILLIPAFYHLRQRFVRFAVTPSMLEIASGVIARSTRNVPLSRIQDVTVRATLLQRVFGLGDVVVDNASESGGKLVVKNIDSPRTFAGELLRQMKRLEKT